MRALRDTSVLFVSSRVGHTLSRVERRWLPVMDALLSEGATVLLGHDIMKDAGRYAADTHTVTVGVSDGQFNLMFVSAGTKEPPAVNAIRVVQVR